MINKISMSKRADRPAIILSQDHAASGIGITYIKSSKTFWVNGWYDHRVGIEGHEIPLQEFIDRLQLPVVIKENK